MESEASSILNKVKLGQWNIQEVKTYLRSSTVNNRGTYVQFCENFFRGVAAYLYSCLGTGLPKHNCDLEILVKIVFECHDFILDARANNCAINSLLVQRSLYHIMQYLLKWNCDLTLLGLNRLYDELSREEPEKIMADSGTRNSWKVIVQNSYLLLWNAAVVVEQRAISTECHVNALTLRQEALKYLILSSPDLVKFCGQATKAAKTYHAHLKITRCPKLDNFFKEVYALLGQQLRDLKVASNIAVSCVDLLKSSFILILGWFDYLLQCGQFIEAEALVTSFVLDVVEMLIPVLSSKSKADYLFCTDVMLLALHFHPLVLEHKRSPLTTNLNVLVMQCLHVDFVLESEFSECMALSFSLLRKQISAVSEILPKNLNLTANLYDRVTKLKKLLKLFRNLRHFKWEQNANEISQSMDVYNLFTFYGHLLQICFWSLKFYTQTDRTVTPVVTDILNTANDIAVHYSLLIDKCDDPKKYTNYYISIMGNLTAICYSNGWLIKAVQLLQPCMKYYKNLMLVADVDEKTSILSRVELLVHCLRKLELYKDALNVIAEMLAIDRICQKELLTLWVKVKRDAKFHGSQYKSLIQTTTRELVPKFALPGHVLDLGTLLKCEAAIYQAQAYDTTEESLAVHAALVQCCPDAIIKAVALIETANLHLGTVDIETVRTCINSCQDAIRLLNSIESKGKREFPSDADCWLAHAYFILHFFEAQETEAASEREVDCNCDYQVTEQNDTEKQTFETWSPTPSYQHITVEMEYKSLHSLDAALNMWSSIISMNPFIIQDATSTLNKLKAVAGKYSLVRMVSNEVKACKLTLELAKAVGNDVEYGLAVARLVTLLSRHGLTHEALSYLKDFKSGVTELNCTEDEKRHLRISLLLAESELLLMQNKVVDGWKCLQDVRMTFDSAKEKSVHFELLWSEAQLLWSRFSELPFTLLPRDSNDDHSPISLTLYCLRCCSQLVRKGPTYNSKYSRVLAISLKHRLFTLLFDCALRLGLLYHDIGAPREAKCFLNERLILSQKLSLAYRTAEILLVAAKVDIMCDSFSDCHVKLYGVAYILECVGSKPASLSKSELQSLSVSPDDKTHMASVDGGELTDSPFVINTNVFSSSPLATRNSNSPKTSLLVHSSFIEILKRHSARCLCIKCNQIVFHHLRLELACLQAECLYVQNGACMKALASMTEILQQAESCCELEKGLLLHLLGNEAKQKRMPKLKNRNYVEPFLHLRVIACRNLCKIAGMYLEKRDLNNAYNSIKDAYEKLSAIPWLGIGQSHFLMATIMYLYCIVKLVMFSNSQGCTAMGILDKNWFGKKSKSDVTGTDDLHFITDKIENVHLVDNPSDGFKTPLVVQKPRAKLTSNAQDTSSSATGTGSRTSDYPINDQTLCKAPVKKNLLLSFGYGHPSYEEPERISVELAPASKSKSRRVQKAKVGVRQNVDRLFSEATSTEKSSSETQENVSGNSDSFDSSKRPTKPLKIATPFSDRGNSDVEDFGLSKRVDVVHPGFSSFNKEANPLPESTLLVAKGSHDDPFILTSSTDSNSPCTPARKTKSTAKRISRRKKDAVQDVNTHSRKIQMQSRSMRKKIQVARLEQEDLKTSLPDILLQCPEFSVAEAEISREMNTEISCLDSSLQLQHYDVKNISQSAHLDPEDFFRKIFGDSEICRSKSPAVVKQTRKTRSTKPVPHSSEVIGDSKDFPLQAAIGYLEKALSLICHHPPVPLYSDLNMLMALLKGEASSKVTYHLFEANAVRLRHQTLFTLAEKISLLEKGSNDTMAFNASSLEISKLCRRKLEFAFGTSRYDNWDMHLDSICDKLPADWIVCQINTVPSQINTYLAQGQKLDLIITRLQHASQPLVVKIPHKPITGVAGFMQEFDAIIKTSVQSTKVTNSKLWWETRFGLDQRLQVLLESIENKWLGYWKGLLLGSPIQLADQQKLKAATSKIVNYLNSLGFTSINRGHLEVIMDSIPWLQVSQLRRVMAEILKLSFSDPKLREVCMQIQQACKYLSSEKVPRKSVILILDKELQQLPWENIPMLRCQPVTRLMSIHFLLSHFILYEGKTANVGQNTYATSIDTSNAFYVLNPDSNLPRTEEYFISYFESLNWPGITAQRPTTEQWKDSLTSRDLFVYCGHGSGSPFLRSDALRKVDCKACALLMGCRSAKLDVQGRTIEPRGIVQQYLIAGCPSIVGNLWDVTDKDIDRFLETLLKKWLPGTSQEEQCLSRCLASSRQICHLPYMIGAAPVIYGLPVRAS